MWKNQNVRLVAVFIAGVLVGMALFWQGSHRTPSVNKINVSSNIPNIENSNAAGTAPDSIAVSSLNENDGSAQTIAQAPSLKVGDQNPGKMVVVAQAVLDQPEWVVIHDSDSNGQPGNVLGARLFAKGRNSGIVQLLQATVAGQKYIAVVHTYSGAKTPFDSKVDLPMKTASGDLIMSTFSVTKATN